MSYTHLTRKERYQIQDLYHKDFTNTYIAKQLGRSVSTIGRELKRNVGPKGFKAKSAHNKARGRLIDRGKKNVRRVSDAAWEEAKTKLVEDWSPEQIAGSKKRLNEERISHETIYKRIALDRENNGELYRLLRCKKQRRRRYGSKKKGDPKIHGRIGIDHRPPEIMLRQRVGDWEGDTIIGSRHSGALVTLVERKSRYLLMQKVEKKTANGVANAIIRMMIQFHELSLTMTFDNGSEFCFHQLISEALKMDVYFAHSYSPWERGTNENTNGLIRKYFKKNMMFDTLSDEEIALVERKLNNRPRKALNYQTPYEVFNEACKKQGIALAI